MAGGDPHSKHDSGPPGPALSCEDDLESDVLTERADVSIEEAVALPAPQFQISENVLAPIIDNQEFLAQP